MDLNEEYGWHITSFFDLLGCKDAYKENGEYIDERYNQQDPELRKRLGKAHKTFINVKTVRSVFKSYFNTQYGKPTIPEFDLLDDKSKEIFLAQREENLEMIHFTDCIIFSIKCKNPKMYTNIISNLHILLQSIGVTFDLPQLVTPNFVRGV